MFFFLQNLRVAIVDKNIRESQELWKIAALNEALDEWMKKVRWFCFCFFWKIKSEVFYYFGKLKKMNSFMRN